MKRLIILYIMLGFSLIVFAQPENSKKKYEYGICVPYKDKGKSKIVQNEIIENLDTNVTRINGKVSDYKNESIPYSIVIFKSEKDSSLIKKCFADSLGNFEMYLFPSTYHLTIYCVGYVKLAVNKLQIKSGELRKVEVKLGEAGGFAEYKIWSDKPLTKRKLKRYKRILSRKR